MRFDAAPELQPETFPLRGAGVIVLDERGVRHPRRPRGGSFVHTPYEDIVHVACSPRAMWLGSRRSVYVFPRRGFEQPEAPERLIRALAARLADTPGGEAQLARMARIERFSHAPAPTRATFGLAALCLAVFALHLLLGREVEDVGYYNQLLVADGDWWRLFTANLLHGFPKVPVHLVLNLLGLVALGTLAERPLGFARTLLVMGAAGVLGMLASGWAGHPRVVGVSGVVFGLLGAITWLELRAAHELPAWWRVPRRAIYGKDRIYKLVDDRMQRLTVERVGSYWDADGRRFELIRNESLQDGDQIIITQLPNAIDGLLVKTREAPP